MQNNLSIRDYCRMGISVKRFSYVLQNNVVIVKPEPGQIFLLHEDFLGSRSIVWIVCWTDDGELWRQNIESVVRVTYHNPVNLQASDAAEQSTETVDEE